MVNRGGCTVALFLQMYLGAFDHTFQEPASDNDRCNRSITRITDDLFTNFPKLLNEEFVETLAKNDNVRVERIVSTGHVSPENFWYDQDEHEWVVVLKGQAKLLFEGDNQAIHMHPGDHIHIAAGQRHRVQWTTPDQPTIWLAVFYAT